MASNKFKKAMDAIHKLDTRIQHLIDTGEMPGKKHQYKFDYLKCMLAYGAAPTDYIFLRMYKKNGIERRNLISYRKQNKIDRTMNNYDADMSTIANKAKFNEYLGDRVNRGWIYSENASADELMEFFEKYKTVFFKPVNLTQGEGIKRLKIENPEDVAFLKGPHDCKFLLEEEIKQAQCLKDLNPYAVNSLRVTTVCNRDATKAEVLSASLKLSVNETCVDNLCAGGLVFPIDIETGVIARPGLSYADDDYHIIHPVSHKIVVGTQIPNFQDIRETLVENAKKFPDFRYLGWDIAVTDNGFTIIEVNTSPDPRLSQSSGNGLYNKIKKYM